MWFKVKFQIYILVLSSKTIFPESFVKRQLIREWAGGENQPPPPRIPDVEKNSLDILGLK